jgi:hypothetical protein
VPVQALALGEGRLQGAAASAEVLDVLGTVGDGLHLTVDLVDAGAAVVGVEGGLEDPVVLILASQEAADPVGVGPDLGREGVREVLDRLAAAQRDPLHGGTEGDQIVADVVVEAEGRDLVLVRAPLPVDLESGAEDVAGLAGVEEATILGALEVGDDLFGLVGHLAPDRKRDGVQEGLGLVGGPLGAVGGPLQGPEEDGPRVTIAGHLAARLPDGDVDEGRVHGRDVLGAHRDIHLHTGLGLGGLHVGVALIRSVLQRVPASGQDESEGDEDLGGRVQGSLSMDGGGLDTPAVCYFIARGQRFLALRAFYLSQSNATPQSGTAADFR